MSQSVEQLNKEYGLVLSAGELVKVVAGNNSLPKVILWHPTSKATAEIYLHGAHVTSWKTVKPNTNELVEHLFVSSKSVFDGAKAIRGGIPICWPQFSNRGPLQAHGWVRNLPWKLARTGFSARFDDTATILAEFLLDHTMIPRELIDRFGNAEFEVRYVVEVGGDESLETRLEVTNVSGQKDLEFTTALHTYFKIADINRTKIDLGANNLQYIDNTISQPSNKFISNSNLVEFRGEVDRIFANTPSRVVICDQEMKEVLAVKTDANFPDTVVWNIGEEKGKKIADLGSGEDKLYVCVESGAIVNPVVLKPGQRWKASQKFYVPSANKLKGSL